MDSVDQVENPNETLLRQLRRWDASRIYLDIQMVGAKPISLQWALFDGAVQSGTLFVQQPYCGGLVDQVSIGKNSAIFLVDPLRPVELAQRLVEIVDVLTPVVRGPVQAVALQALLGPGLVAVIRPRLCLDESRWAHAVEWLDALWPAAGQPMEGALRLAATHDLALRIEGVADAATQEGIAIDAIKKWRPAARPTVKQLVRGLMAKTA